MNTTDAISPIENQPNWRNLAAACGAITVFGFPLGLTYPLLSLILEARGVSSELIGLNGAMMPLGILVFSVFIPVMTKRFGERNVAIGAALLTAVTILAYKQFDTLSAWFLIRFLQGMSISVLFVLSEAWIVGFSGDKHRGKIVAIYGTILSASFGLGPFIISVIGIEGWLPFILGTIIVLVGVIPLLFIQLEATPASGHAPTLGISSFASKAPMLLACVCVFSIFDAATLSLFSVYGVKVGLSLADSANLLTVLMLANVFFQLPIGWLADRYPHRRVLLGCALVATITLMVFPLLIGTLSMWPTLVVMGAAGFGLYTVTLVSLGDRFTGSELIDGMSAFSVVWGLGALFGSIMGGWAMAGFGPHGLPVSLGVVFLMLSLGLCWRRITRGKAAIQLPH
ncbi:MAG: MFS family permease [Gammaproteobacteria bacterium]|jgi:MFS family permease